MAEACTADVVVIGAGVVGCSTALELARLGLRVVVHEKRRVGWAASGRNGGAIRAHGRSHHELPLALASRARWAELAAESPVDFHFERSGDLIVGFTEVEEARLRASAAWYVEHGLEVEVLDGDAARGRFPFLGPGVRAAAWCASDALAYPILAARALGVMARAAGAVVVEGSEVTGIDVAGGRVTGVRTTTGPTAAGVVAITAGPWAGLAAGLAGVTLPRRSQMLVTERMPPTIGPFVSGRGIYLRQSPYGNLLVGGGGAWESVGFEQAGTSRTLHRLASRFLWVCPELRLPRVLRGWGGTVELTPDHRPHIGPLPGVDGLLVAAGVNGNGFAMGPVAGELLADLATGATPRFDLTAFRPDRFPPGADPYAGYRERTRDLVEPVHVP